MNVSFNYIHPSRWPAGQRRGVSEWHRMTADALKECNKRRLAQLAQDKGIAGWHAMRKDQLIRALSASRSAPSKVAKKKPRPAVSAPRAQEAGQRRRGAPPRRGAGRVGAAPGPDRAGPHAGPCLPEGPHHRPDPRFLLAARLLGAQPDDSFAGAGRPGARLARGTPDPESHGRLERRHDLGRRAARPRHPDPRRRE